MMLVPPLSFFAAFFFAPSLIIVVVVIAVVVVPLPSEVLGVTAVLLTISVVFYLVSVRDLAFLADNDEFIRAQGLKLPCGAGVSMRARRRSRADNRVYHF